MTEAHPADLDQPIGFVLMMRPGSARVFVDQLKGAPGGMFSQIATELEKQIPVQLPEKVGAVVESSDGTFYIRWATDSHTHHPWIMALDHENPIRSEDLPLITKVHFEGVDL
jgi:hypothetical protein